MTTFIHIAQFSLVYLIISKQKKKNLLHIEKEKKVEI